ncbi:MAG: endonuclease [Muribaculaceae bacterium]|nr:endonuclease [Muribaculaceae bacterium]
MKTFSTAARRFNAVLIAVLSVVAAFGAIPAGYYTGLNGKTGADLKTAAFNIINPHFLPASYSEYYTNLKVTFMQTDLYPDSQRWWDMYSDIPFYAPSFSGLNREHSLPKSWWGGSTNIPPYVDLNHLYPSEMKANTAKSNYPLGEVVTASFDNGISRVGSPASGQGGGAGKVFEPADEYKGDFARTYFYMVTCYQTLNWKYTYMTQNNTYPSMQPWAVQMLLRWAEEDPVSQKEIDRNEAVYRLQNNRNPFIDFPHLAEYIWGDKVGELFYVTSTPDQPAGDPVLSSPVDGMSLDFNQVAIGSSSSATLILRGENITNNVSLMLTGTNRSMYKLSETSITPSRVNSTAGCQIAVTYTPTELGEHIGTLTIFDYDNTGSSINVSLHGECLPVPTLSRVVATEATEIMPDSYVANWEVPQGDIVDYYIVTRTYNVNGVATTVELPAEDNWLKIEDFDQSDSESYSVQSVRLGYRSPMSNVIFVQHSGVVNVDNDLPLEIIVDHGLMIFNTAVPQYGARVYDITGKVVAAFDEITPGMSIPMAPGVYFVTTATHPVPVKVMF